MQHAQVGGHDWTLRVRVGTGPCWGSGMQVRRGYDNTVGGRNPAPPGMYKTL